LPTEKETEEKPDEEKEEKKVEAEPKVEKKKIKIDGQEEELTEDEIISYAQKGKDYTRKTQQLAEEKNALTPYSALIKQLQADPNLSKHIADYWQKPIAKEESPKFEDPIEQLKWEIKQDILGETNRKIQEATIPFAKQFTIQQVQARVMADPDYQEVHGKILEYVQGLPPTLQKTAYLQLDQDTNSYLEMFNHFKGLKASDKKEPTPPVKTPEPVKKTERAPILESSNTAPSEEAVAGQKVKLDKSKAKALKNGSVEALQEYLEAGGFLNNIL